MPTDDSEQSAREVVRQPHGDIDSAGGDAGGDDEGDDDERSVEYYLRYGWIGPVPDPLTLQQFREIDSTFPSRLIEAFEVEGKHRREMERIGLRAEVDDLKADRRQSGRGQWCALTMGVLSLLITFGLIALGHDVSGTILGGGTLGSIVAIFLKYPKRDLQSDLGEPVEKDQAEDEGP